MGAEEKDSCRICKTTGHRVSVRVFDVQDLIEKIIGTKIQLKPSQPVKICVKCHNRLREYLAFRQLCLQSEQELSDYQLEVGYENYEMLVESVGDTKPEVRDVGCQVGDYMCEVCNKCFNLRNSYDAHMNRVHNIFKQKRYPKAEKDRKVNKEHVKQEDERIYIEKLPPGPTKITYITREAMEKGVLGDDLFKCWVCDKEFTIQNSYRAHMNRSHGLYVNKNNSSLGLFNRQFPNLKKPLIDFDDKSPKQKKVAVKKKSHDSLSDDEDQISYHDTSHDEPEEDEEDEVTQDYEEPEGDDDLIVEALDELDPTVTDEIIVDEDQINFQEVVQEDEMFDSDQDSPEHESHQIKIEVVDMKEEVLDEDFDYFDMSEPVEVHEHSNDTDSDDEQIKNIDESSMPIIKDGGNSVRHCCLCVFKASNYTKLYLHVKAEHPKARKGRRSPNQKLQCRNCWALFTSETDLQAHLDQFIPKIVALQCKLCLKIYTKRTSFQTHVNRRHGVMLGHMDPILKDQYEIKLEFEDYKRELKKQQEVDEKLKQEKEKVLPNLAVLKYCCQCDFSSTSYKPIYDHFIAEHPLSGRVGVKPEEFKTDCRICYKKFATYEELRQHLNRFKPNVGRYTCQICLNSYDKPNSYRVHMRDKHGIYKVMSQKKVVEMDDLGENAMVVEMLEDVEVSESTTLTPAVQSKPLHCVDVEEEVKKLRQKLNRASDKVTNPPQNEVIIRRFGRKCCQCPFTSHDYKEVHRHFLSTHKDARANRTWKKGCCKWCWQSFPTHSALIRHTRGGTQELGPVQCDVCAKICTNKQRLIEHFARVHRPKENICDQCGKAFAFPNVLGAHIQRRHTNERNSQCKICMKFYKNQTDLNRHMIRHTGVKPWSCDVCGKCFSDRSDWVRHQVVHTGIYLYNCPVPSCKKGFQRKKALTEHLSTHGPELRDVE